jgi:hypothetical protein
MAKQLKKLPDFFNGHRKECRLINYQALVSKGDEKRIKLSVEIILSNKNVKHLADRFVPLFGLMEKEDSTTNLAKEAVTCEEMTVDIFATPDSSRASKTITACTFLDFKLVGAGEKDKREVALEFIIYMPADAVLNEWAFKHLHKTFFIESVPAQRELPLTTSKQTSLAVVPANGAAKANGKPEPAKSGPKDLEKHHQAEVAKGNKSKPSPAAVQ